MKKAFSNVKQVVNEQISISNQLNHLTLAKGVVLADAGRMRTGINDAGSGR